MIRISLVLISVITLFLIVGTGISFSQEITPTPLCIRYDYPDQALVFNCPTTELPFDTPTPEVVATNTPTPTPTFTPSPTEELKCWGVVVDTDGTGLNVRDNAGGNWIGKLEEGDILTLEYRQTYLDYVWYGFWWGVDVTGWSHSNWIEVHGDCSQISDIPPQVTRQGPHILMGEGGSSAINFSNQITAAKCLPGSLQICLNMKAINPDMWVVARLFTDSIIIDNGYNVDTVWNLVKDQIPDGYDAFELENEKTPLQEDWNKYIQFQIDFADRLGKEKNIQYLAFAFGPGWPYEHLVPLMIPYLEWVAEHPFNGKYHGISSHAAPYTTFTRDDMPWLNTFYISGRVYWMADILADNGFDLESWPGIWAVTELGLSGGYSGDWDATYSCEEVADAYWTTVKVYQEHGYPDILLWWNLGKISIWQSDDACVNYIWN